MAAAVLAVGAAIVITAHETPSDPPHAFLTTNPAYVELTAGFELMAYAQAFEENARRERYLAAFVELNPTPAPVYAGPVVTWTTLPPPSRTWITDIVCDPMFTWDCDWALATIDCESGGNPNAHGVEGSWHFFGLFQVVNGSTDPYANAVEAHIKFAAWQRGEVPRPWPNCP